jgi:hypothetical protein
MPNGEEYGTSAVVSQVPHNRPLEGADRLISLPRNCGSILAVYLASGIGQSSGECRLEELLVA